MDVTFSDLLLEENHILSTIASDAHSVCTTHIGKNVYAVINVAGTVSTIDVNKLLSFIPGINLTLSYYDIITSVLTQNLINETVVTYLPKLDTSTQKYLYRINTVDPIAAEGWDIGFGNIDYPDIISDQKQISILDDLIIYPPAGTTLTNLLVSVNGVFHSTTVYNDTLYVIDGFANIKQVGTTNICVVDTTAIGGHSTIPLTSSMLKSPDATLYQSAQFALGQSLLGKTACVVVDGYIYLFDDAHQFMNDSTLCLNVNMMDIASKFVNSPMLRYQQNFFAIKNRPNPYNPDTYIPVTQPKHATEIYDETLDAFNTATTISSDTLNSSAFIKQRLTSPHSFVIVFNNPNLFISSFQLVNFNEPRVYECMSEDTPRGLLVYNQGKVLPYNITSNRSSNQHMIYLNAPETTTDLFTTGIDNPSIPSGHADLQNTAIVKHAYLYDIYTGTAPS